MRAKRLFLLGFLSLVIMNFGSRMGSTQDYQPDIHVIVNMVQLNVAVTDKKGNYVTGLRPEDFARQLNQIPEGWVSAMGMTITSAQFPAASRPESIPNALAPRHVIISIASVGEIVQ